MHSDSQIQPGDCALKVVFLGNGSLDPLKLSESGSLPHLPPLAARVCPGKFIGIIDFAARAALGPGRPGVAAIEAV